MFVFPIRVFIGLTECWWAAASGFALNRATTVSSTSDANLEGYSQGLDCKQKLVEFQIQRTNAQRSLREL